jgi:hypothetical protein
VWQCIRAFLYSSLLNKRGLPTFPTARLWPNNLLMFSSIIIHIIPCVHFISLTRLYSPRPIRARTLPWCHVLMAAGHSTKRYVNTHCRHGAAQCVAWRSLQKRMRFDDVRRISYARTHARTNARTHARTPTCAGGRTPHSEMQLYQSQTEEAGARWGHEHGLARCGESSRRWQIEGRWQQVAACLGGHLPQPCVPILASAWEGDC